MCGGFTERHPDGCWSSQGRRPGPAALDDEELIHKLRQGRWEDVLSGEERIALPWQVGSAAILGNDAHFRRFPGLRLGKPLARIVPGRPVA